MSSFVVRSLSCMVRRATSFVSNRASITFQVRLAAMLAAAVLMVCTGAHKTLAQTTFSGGGSISISGPNGSGSSTLSVTGASGSVNTISVTLNGVTSQGPRIPPPNNQADDSVGFTSFVLQSPGGQKFILLGCTGDSTDGDDSEDTGNGLSSVTINISDSNSSDAPQGVAWQHTGTANVKPSSYWENQNDGCLPLASLPSDVNGDAAPQTDGSATLNGTFASATSNGTWTLYILTDDTFNVVAGNDPVSISSWSLTMTFNAGASDSTVTTVSSNIANPGSTANSYTYTATVSDITNPGTTVNDGTVAFTANGTTISGCGAKPISGGQATCTTTFPTQGLYPIVASYSAGTGFASSASTVFDQLVEHPSANTTGDTWCNTGSFTSPGDGAGIAYPSVIKVTGYGAQTVANVEVELVNVTGVIDAQHLLVAPDGTHNLDFFDFGFNPGDSTSTGINLDFADSFTGSYPDSNNPPVSANYLASDILNEGNTDTFPSSTAPTYDNSIPQVPGTVNYGYDHFTPGAHGPITETFGSNFGGVSADGTWALYPYAGFDNAETFNGGWCIALTLNPSSGAPTTTTLGSNANPQVAQTPVTVTATVKASGTPVTSGGTVTFLQNGGLPSGVTSPNNVVNLSTSNGQASLTTGTVSNSVDIGAQNETGSDHFMTIYEGDYAFTGEYSGSSSDDASDSATFWQRFDDSTTLSAGSGGSINACNTGAVLLDQANNRGPFEPNPSNIFVSGIPGTINTVTLSLNGFYTAGEGSLSETESLIAGPGGALDFFTNTGDAVTAVGSTLGPLSSPLTFEDSASGTVPYDNGNGITSIAAGSYKPTSNGTTADTFTSSSSGFYNVPGSIKYARPHGSDTFASTFGSTNPNGTWSLFFNTANAVTAEGAQSGWCLNFSENPVTVTVDENHSGTGTSGDFIQGETGAQITTVITNNGPGPTGDPLGTNKLTVTDTLNSALTYASFSGTDWSCSAGGQTVTCTNDSAVASGSAYPTLTLNVSVSSSAPASISNSASVSGAGITANSGSDTIQVQGLASLAISKSHTGSFTQGSTGTWTLMVSNTAASGSTSGTVTVSDTLPTGYTLSSSTSTGSLFSCSGTSTVTCTGTPGIAAGGSNTITLTVNIPADSPTSVSNTASTWGGGDPVHDSAGTAAASNTDTVSVIATTTTAAANATATFSASNQNLTLNATVTSTAGTVTSGTVTFTVMQGATQIGASTSPANVSNGTATASYTLPGGTNVGTYTIVASYTGAGSFPSSSDNTHTLTVTAAGTTTAAANQSAMYSASSQNVTLSASVTSAAGTVNAGTVTFTVLNGGTPIGTATTSGTVTTGNASVSYTLPVGTAGGTYTIQAVYNGSTDFTSSTDNTHTLSVVGGTTTTSASSVSATYNSFLQPVILNATITSGGGTVNSGTVTFTVMQGATQIGTTAGPATVSNGSATGIYTLPSGTSAGTYTIVASYTGAGGFTSSSDNTHTLTVNAASTTTTGSNQTATFSSSSQVVTLSATVTSAAGTVNAGTVTFTVLNGGTPVGTATTSSTVAGGSASANYTLPAGTPAGVYTIDAVYSGSTNFTGSVDTTHVLAVSGAGTITAASNASATYNANNTQSVTLTATVNSPNGVVNEGTVTLTVLNGSTPIGSAAMGPVSGGSASATFTLPAGTAIGSYTIQAVYTDPAGNFTTSNDGTHSLAVNPIPGFIVTNTDDSGSGSLRAALQSAATAGGGNITFDASAFGSGGTIVLQSGLTIPDNTTITGLTSGSGASLTNLVTVDGAGGSNGQFSVFTVDPSATVAIANLTISGGSDGGGGAINNAGTLAVTNSTFSGNSTPGGGLGGAILNSGALTVTGSTFSGNSAGGPGGAIFSYGTLQVTNSTFNNNASGTLGGGIYMSNGAVMVTGSTFSGNSANSSSGGGIYINTNDTLTVTNSVFTNDSGGECAGPGNGCPVNGTNGNIVDPTGTLANLAALGNYGGPTQTTIPLPGSAAICAGLTANIPNGVTTDQRGVAFNAGGYCPTDSVDAGAVGTDYAMSFTAPVSNVAPDTAMSPAPAVTLDEDGAPFTAAAVTIPLALTSTPSGATLSGGSASTSAGVATYSSLMVDLPGTGDQLTATLGLNASPAVSISAESGTFNVSKITPTLSFAPNPASQSYGTAITAASLDATANYNSTTVPGSFVYTTTVGGNPVTLVAGTTVLPASSYTITAAFTPSDPAVYTGASTTASFMVNATPLTITASTATMNYGGTVPTITASYGGFVNGDTPASLTTLPTCSTTATSHSDAGAYTTSCSGAVDTNYTISYVTGTVTVAAVPLTITASSGTMTYGGTVLTITPSYSGFVNGDSATSLTTQPTCSTTATIQSPVGTYPSSCSGAVDGNYTIGYMTGLVTVGQAASITTVGLSSTSITPGQSETITVTVASSTTGTPTGSVGIYDGTTLLTTVTLSNGTGSYTTTTLAPSITHVITAVYSGDTDFTGSTSTASASVTVAPLDFTMTIAGPSVATVIPGHSISYQVTVTPLYGSYAGTVNFAITGLPPGASVTFSPSSIAANGGPQTITVTITAAPATAASHAPPSPTRRAVPLALAFLLVFGLGTMRHRGRAVRHLFTIVLLLAGGAAATLVSGCGGGFFAQAPQNYNVTITATAGNLQHTANVTLNVE